MIKLVIITLALLVALPLSAQAERDMYVLGTGEEPDQETQDKINQTRIDMLRMRGDAARATGLFYYNGDEGVYIGRGGYVPRYNYNGYEARDGVADVCAGARSSRKYERCVEDALEAREDLRKKYRN